MARLTERDFVFSSNYVASKLQSWSIAECLKKLQEYENAEEDGRLVEVVRCGECKMFERREERPEFGFCKLYPLGLSRHETGFCNFGERKENETD